MLRKLNLLLVSFLLTMSYSYAQTGLGSVRGVVTDKKSGEAVYDCSVLMFQNGIRKGAAKTDFDGKFQIDALEPGNYTVEIRNSNEGYKPQRIEGFIVKSDQTMFLNDVAISKTSDVLEIDEIEVVAFKVPLIDKDGGASGATITREDIARLPVRSAAAVAGTVGGVNTNEGSGAISVRGSRTDATYF